MIDWKTAKFRGEDIFLSTKLWLAHDGWARPSGDGLVMLHLADHIEIKNVAYIPG